MLSCQKYEYNSFDYRQTFLKWYKDFTASRQLSNLDILASELINFFQAVG